jgi:hypothetical protein
LVFSHPHPHPHPHGEQKTSSLPHYLRK